MVRPAHRASDTAALSSVCSNHCSCCWLEDENLPMRSCRDHCQTLHHPRPLTHVSCATMASAGSVSLVAHCTPRCTKTPHCGPPHHTGVERSYCRGPFWLMMIEVARQITVAISRAFCKRAHRVVLVRRHERMPCSP